MNSGPRRFIDVAQFGGEIGTLAEQGVAPDAVVLLPDALAGGDGRVGRDLRPLVALRQHALRVQRHAEEQEDGKSVPP